MLRGGGPDVVVWHGAIGVASSAVPGYVPSAAVADEDLVSAEGGRSALYPPGVLRWGDGRHDPRLKLR
jgi:hypothetical protein